MQISYNDWIRYKNMLAAIDEKAAELMVNWLASQGGYINVPKDKLISYAYALASKYGEASAAAAAQMYDEIAEASGVSVSAAEVAETATYGEMAKAINGVTKKLTTDSQIGNVVGRHAKLAGADTMLKNALRDGAEFAWIPSGDTCAFCIMLASNGWQKASYKALKGHHAEHIHANCDCTYAIRFDGKSNVKGYNPEKYRRMYYGAEGDNWRDKLNSMRRMQYAENPEKYRAQNRAWYAKKNGLSAAAGTLPDKMRKYVPDTATRLRIIQEGIDREKAIFCKTDELLYKLAYNLPEDKKYYTVVCHGDMYNVEFNGIKIDPDTLCAIIAQRKDYKKCTDIRLISCYTGFIEDGVAKYISDKLKVNVLAPDLKGIISRDIYGRYEVYSGSREKVHDGRMVLIEYKKG